MFTETKSDSRKKPPSIIGQGLKNAARNVLPGIGGGLQALDLIGTGAEAAIPAAESVVESTFEFLTPDEEE